MLTKITLLGGLFLLQFSCGPKTEDTKKRDDESKVWKLYNASAALYDSSPGRAMDYGLQCLQLAESISFPEGISLGLTNIGYVNYIQGDYPAALDIFLKALEIDNEHNLWERKASHYNHLGNIYKSQENYDTALERYYSSYLVATKYDFDTVRCNASMNLGYVYEKLARRDSMARYIDSALFFENVSLQLVKTAPYPRNLNIIHNNLGKIHSLKGNNDSAVYYFNTAIEESKNSNDVRGRGESSIFLAELYLAKKQYDSSIHFANRGLEDVKSVSYIRGELMAFGILADAHESKLPDELRKKDTALIYFKEKYTRNTLLFNTAKAQQMQQSLIDFRKREEDKKRELAEMKAKKKHDTGIFGISLFFAVCGGALVFVFLKKITNRHLEGAAMAFILLVFEFANQLLHPLIGEVTGHNVVLMFIILGLIAFFILNPIHHFLEHWIKSKFSVNKHTPGKVT